VKNDNLLLQASGVEKSFSGVRVLKNVHLEVRRGEIHALMGENGAGKSTLIKILTGVLTRDAGKVLWCGQEVALATRKEAHRLGIGCIYQELSLVPTLTVGQNILLGQETTRGGFLQTPLMKKKLQDLISSFGLAIPLDSAVETLSIAQRQLVEILKALSRDSSLLIMDEPTASLSAHEAETLFRAMQILKERGVSILYISHRLEEVNRLADRLTVLRDGEVVGVLSREQIRPGEMIRLMIGREIEAGKQRALTPSTRPEALRVCGLGRHGVFADISFTVREGEIVGVGGLVGSGRTELLRCLFGADLADTGTVQLAGKVLGSTMKARIKAGFGLVPEDRRGQGLVPLLSIQRNLALTNHDLPGAGKIFLRSSFEADLCVRSMESLDVRPRFAQMPVENLSGGNQQKVVLGKWLARDLRVLLVDEPTVGIDVGVKEEIYGLLQDLAEKGVLVLLVSSDLPELLRVSHRILILRQGRLFAEFRRGVVTQEDLLRAISGIESGAAL